MPAIAWTRWATAVPLFHLLEQFPREVGATTPTTSFRRSVTTPTATKIIASGPKYVLGGAAQLFTYACDIGVALVLYELLKPASRRVALLATFFRLVFAAIHPKRHGDTLPLDWGGSWSITRGLVEGEGVASAIQRVSEAVQ